MKQSSLETIFSQSYLKPALRTKIGNVPVYVADGIVPPDQLLNFENTFGLRLDEVCYATIWMAEVGQGRFLGGALEFAMTHDLDLSPESRRQARIKSAVSYAQRDLTKLKKLH